MSAGAVPAGLRVTIALATGMPAVSRTVSSIALAPAQKAMAQIPSTAAGSRMHPSPLDWHADGDRSAGVMQTGGPARSRL